MREACEVTELAADFDRDACLDAHVGALLGVWNRHVGREAVGRLPVEVKENLLKVLKEDSLAVGFARRLLLAPLDALEAELLTLIVDLEEIGELLTASDQHLLVFRRFRLTLLFDIELDLQLGVAIGSFKLLNRKLLGCVGLSSSFLGVIIRLILSFLFFLELFG